jgi:hypothetical protein
MPNANGVSVLGEYDWNCFGRLSGGLDLSRSRRKNDIDICADELGCEIGHFGDPWRPPELNDNVLAIDVAEVAQACP